MRWWFVIRAEESVLEQLQKEWNLVAMQTDWKLTPLLQYTKSNPEAQLYKQPNPSLQDNATNPGHGPCNPEKPAESDSDAQQSLSGMQQVSPNEQTNTPVVQQSSQLTVNTDPQLVPKAMSRSTLQLQMQTTLFNHFLFPLPLPLPLLLSPLPLF